MGLAGQGPTRVDWTGMLVQRFWDGFSKTRLTELSFSRAAAPSIALAVWGHLRPDGIHLDLGAGDGDLVSVLLDSGFRVAAHEPSRERRRVLDGRFAERRGFLGCRDATDSERFDVVILCEVIEHILDSDFESFLAGLGQRLKPNGTLIVTTPNVEDLELNSSLCPVCGTLFHRWQHQRSFTAQSLEEAMEHAGMETTAIHQVEFRQEYFLPYADYLRGNRPLPGRILAKDDAQWLPWPDRLRWRWGDLVRRWRRAYRVVTSQDEDLRLVPNYVHDLREDRAAYVGAGTQLLYIGRKINDAAK